MQCVPRRGTPCAAVLFAVAHGGHDCGARNTVCLITWWASVAHERHSCDMYNIVALNAIMGDLDEISQNLK